MMPCNTNPSNNQNQRWSLTDDGQLQLMFNTAKCLTAAGTGNDGEGRADVVRAVYATGQPPISTCCRYMLMHLVHRQHAICTAAAAATSHPTTSQ
jgi:hypothetical protein